MEAIIAYFLVVRRGDAKNSYWMAIYPDGHTATHFLKRNCVGRNYVSAWSAQDDFKFSWPDRYISTKRLPMVII